MLLHSEITEGILGALFAVHNKLGNSYQEKYYQRALAIEFKKKGIVFEREKEIPIFYERRKIGFHSLDFVVNNQIVVELKTKPILENKDQIQLLSYMNHLQTRVGILANFRPSRLEFKRLFLPEKYIKNQKSSF